MLVQLKDSGFDLSTLASSDGATEKVLAAAAAYLAFA